MAEVNSFKIVEGRMSTEVDDYYYKMDHEKKGVAIIFNHEKFDMTTLPKRKGTETDCKNLQQQLERLHFDVTVHNDSKYEYIIKVTSEAAKFDYTHHDCFLMVVLTHGRSQHLFAKDRTYQLEELWDKFTGTKAPTLAGKPKMFFVQACQGAISDESVPMNQADNVSQFTIPSQADILIVYSCPPGSKTWCHIEADAWFVQALCQELELNGFNKDLLTILTFVTRRVCYNFEDTTIEGDAPCPFITSTLTRLVKFRNRVSPSSFRVEKYDVFAVSKKN